MKKVVVYSTPICPQCARAKDFLKEKKISFSEIDISKNKEKAEKIFEKAGVKVVPILEIGNEILIGFDKKKIESILKK